MKASRILDLNHKYIPSAKTNVLETFRKLGYTPPSEDARFQEKWFKVRNCGIINEVKNDNFHIRGQNRCRKRWLIHS